MAKPPIFIGGAGLWQDCLTAFSETLSEHDLTPDDSPMIHVIRDGRDVVASLLRMNWQTPEGQPLDYTRDADRAAAYWAGAVTAGRRFAAASAAAGQRYRELRYEDLVREPGVLRFHEQDRNLAAESSAAQVSRGIYRSAIGTWRRALDAGQIDAVMKVAGTTLAELGYVEEAHR